MTNPERREQHGCHDCKHVYAIWEDDRDLGCYCTLNAPPRPPDDSLNKTIAELRALPEKEKPWNLTAAWNEGREVKPWTTCGAHAVRVR